MNDKEFTIWIPGKQKLSRPFLPKNNDRTNVKRGFTLIELLVVIAIIALLSGIVLATLSSARMKARDSQRVAFLRQLNTAVEMFYDSNGHYPGVDDYHYSFQNKDTKWSVHGPNPPVGITAIQQAVTDWKTELDPYIKIPNNFPAASQFAYVTTDGSCKIANPTNASLIQYVTSASNTKYKMSSRLELNCDLIGNDGGTYFGAPLLAADAKGRSGETYELFSSGAAVYDPSW